MIDEALLEDAFAELADEIPVPDGGDERVINQLVTISRPARRDRARFTKPLLAAAAVVVVAGAFAVPFMHSSTSSKSVFAASAPTNTIAAAGRGQRSLVGQPPTNGVGAGISSGVTPSPDISGYKSTQSQTIGQGSGDGATATSGPVDGAKIVKTGTLDLQVPHGTLHVAVNRVSGVTVGLGGYVSASKTSYGGSVPTAGITVRVPAANFDAAVAQFRGMRDVKVLADSENGTDVTGQYTDLQAQLQAATAEYDALLGVLAKAQSIGDILAVHDRVAAAQTVVDQLQSQINQLGNQASYSSLALTVEEKPIAAKTTVKQLPKPETGLAKSWTDARHGFASVIEWLIARSGGALIILLFALALLYAIRYLYPLVRRGLV